MTTKAKKQALNIFSVLGSLNKKQYQFFAALSDEEKKALQPLVVQRWLSGTSDPAQVMLLNEFVNPYVFPLHKHKELLVKLLSVTGSGGGRSKWLKAKGKATSSAPLTTNIIKLMYGYNTRDAIQASLLLTNDDVLELAAELGKQPDEIRALKAELKKR
jgi:hypothetical protein